MLHIQYTPQIIKTLKALSETTSTTQAKKKFLKDQVYISDVPRKISSFYPKFDILNHRVFVGAIITRWKFVQHHMHTIYYPNSI